MPKLWCRSEYHKVLLQLPEKREVRKIFGGELASSFANFGLESEDNAKSFICNLGRSLN